VSDRGVVFRLPTPLANRMVHLHVEARLDDFKQFALRAKLHHYVIGFLSFRPDLLSSEPVVEDDANPAFATPRSYHMLSNILKQEVQIERIYPIIYGTIGYSAGIEFTSYVKVYEKIPDIRAIYDGHYPELSAEPALLYALVEYYDGSDLHKAHLMAFSRHIATEFCVMLIKDVIVKDESLALHPDFDTWLAHYGDYIL